MTYDLKVIEVTVVFIYITYLFSAYRFFFKYWKTQLSFDDVHVLNVTGVSGNHRLEFVFDPARL